MIGVVADDLSGAAEIGAAGLRHGLSAEIILSGTASGKCDLVCVDTDSRSCEADEAGRRAASAAAGLMESGADRIYKKVDSVLRGRVTQEIEAVMKQLGLGRALLVPANPSLGRIIKGERYFICGKLIHKTEFFRDPEYPRASPKVLELIARPKSFSVSIGAANTPLSTSGIVLGEAAVAKDLKSWAALCKTDVLAAGGAEFFAAWLAEVEDSRMGSGRHAAASVSGNRELFVCGTTSQSSREFLSAARTGKTPIFALPSELIWGTEFTTEACEAVARRIISALEDHPRVILHVGLPLRRRPGASRSLTAHLVRLAETVLRQVEVDRIYAEGGATAAALVRRMGWNRLTVLRELAPGVAVLAPDSKPSTWLTIKPGSYLWPAEVRNIPVLEGAVKVSGDP
jgi:uncharacterized protein YgbK (DUF1537 family)